MRRNGAWGGWHVRTGGGRLRTAADGCGQDVNPSRRGRTGWRPGHCAIHKALERRYAATGGVWVAGMCGHVRTTADHCGPLRTDGHKTRDTAETWPPLGSGGGVKKRTNSASRRSEQTPTARTPNRYGLTPLARGRAVKYRRGGGRELCSVGGTGPQSVSCVKDR